MTTLAHPPDSAAFLGAPAPEAFFERLVSVNPFTANRVNGPSGTDVDVDTIHQEPFERVTDLAREAYQESRGLGAVLWGEAGIGKSHLLSRLARWAAGDQRACLVYLHNLQASPDNLPRSLLKAVMSILTQGQTHGLRRTPLGELVFAAVRHALGHDISRIHPWPDVERAFGRLVDQLGQAEPTRSALVDRRAYEVLFRFFRAVSRTGWEYRNDRLASRAVRWLAGDSLDPDEARGLGLAPGRGFDQAVSLADNQEVKQVLVALTQLALFRKQPFVLCLDQVDNLDQEQVAALTRFLEALIDSSPNLLVVTSGVQATLVGYRSQGVIQSSAWDRLAQFEIGLLRITAAEGRTILAARLREFLRPFAGLGPVQQHLRADPLFPLGEAWADAFFRDKIDVRPRDVLNGAREAWRRQQEALRAQGGAAWLAAWDGGPSSPNNGATSSAVLTVEELIDQKVEQKMAEHQAQRRAAPASLPADAANLSGLVQALLEQCRRAGRWHGVAGVERLRGSRHGPRPTLDLIVRLRRPDSDHETSAGLLFLTTASAVSATAHLRRLIEEDCPADRLFLITDERQPLPVGNKGEEYLADLRRRGFRPVELTFAEYALLDALQAAVGLARAGDLEVEERPGQTRRVSEEEVIASHYRRGRYGSAPVLRDLF